MICTFLAQNEALSFVTLLTCNGLKCCSKMKKKTKIIKFPNNNNTCNRDIQCKPYISLKNIFNLVFLISQFSQGYLLSLFQAGRMC